MKTSSAPSQHLANPLSRHRLAALPVLCLVACLCLANNPASAGTLTFSTPQTAGGARPSLAFDANGRPAIAFVNGGVKYTAFDGANWSAAQTVDATGSTASLAFNPATGKAQIAFVKSVAVDGTDREFVHFATLNGTWTVEPTSANDDRNLAAFDPSGRSPNLAIDATGKPHIGWGGPLFNGMNADYSYSTKDGANWVTEVVEGPGGPPFTGEWSSLAINSTGVPAIIYNSHTNAGAGTYRGKYTIRTGGIWSPVEYAIVPLVIDGNPVNIGSPGSALKFDPNDVPHVAYVITIDGANNGIRYATRSADGTWTVETAATVNQPAATSVSLAIHPVNGVPYIAFRDESGGQNNSALKVAHKTTGVWEVETVATGLGIVTTSAAIDPTGTTLGVAYDGKYAFATLSTELTITTGGTLPGGTVGRAYSRTFQRINGTAAFIWSKVSGELPAGLDLNTSTGELSGTPTTAGQNASFRLRVTDGLGATAEKDFTLAISATPAITANATLPPTSLGLAYSQAVAMTGGTAPFVWSKTSGDLPNGVTLNTSTGVLSGTPEVANTFNFTLQVTDANGATASKAFSVVVNNALAWAATTTSPVAPATAGTAYSRTLAAVGGTPPLAWAKTGDGALPNGLTLNPSTGVLSGTPTVANTFNFTVTVTDGNNASVSREFTLVVSAAPVITKPALQDVALANGFVSIPYNYQAEATLGTAPRTWSLATGSLPAGLQLSGTGLISGTPTAAGDFNFTLRVTDQNGAVANRALTLTILAAPVGPSLSLGQGLFSNPKPTGLGCAGCHAGHAPVSGPFPLVGASKLILDTKLTHQSPANSALLGVSDSSKTNLALFLSSKDAQTYTISGVVKDLANQVLGGATVTATSGYLPTRTAVSAANGTYSITGLAAGDYLFSASKAGFSFTPASVELAITRNYYLLEKQEVYIGGNSPNSLPAVNFTANQAPSVTLTSPVNNTAFVSPATVQLAATASDPDGSVAKVAFYADGVLLGTDTTAPYSFTWNTGTAGINVITAVATDNLGLNTTSAPVTIQILTPVGVPGINLGNGNAIYASRCASCHGSPPGGLPTWSGIAKNYHPGILANRNRIGREFLEVPLHVAGGISNYLANAITESEKSDLAAYLASKEPARAYVSGTVRNGSGQPVAGATVEVRSIYNPGVSVTTDSAGNYRVEGLFAGDYTVTAASEGINPLYPMIYTIFSGQGPWYRAVFADEHYPYLPPYQNGPNMDFVPGHRIQGFIRNANGRGFKGIRVQAIKFGTSRDSALSDENGQFTLVVPDNTYTVQIAQDLEQPQPLTGYTFSPASHSDVIVAGADQSGVNFTVTTAPTLTISGKVTEPGPDGAGMSGVTITLAEAPSVTAITDVNGNYTLTSPDPGTYTVTPTKPLHLFTPETQVATAGLGSRTNVNFTGMLNSFYISGTVRTRDLSSGPPSFNTIPGEPVPNVAISVPGQTVYTDANGNYRLVVVNGNYTITAARDGYFFETPTRAVTVNGASLTGQHFSGDLLVAYVSTGGNNNNDGSSLNSAKSSIQKAINVTAKGGTVIVGGGIYYERISFAGRSLYGGGTATINGKPLPFGEQFERGRVVEINTTTGIGTHSTRLDGFTILNGLATSPSTGGGVFCQATDSEAGPVVIANNRISDNYASSGGGGIFLFGKATITNNVIIRNSTGEFVGGAGIRINSGFSGMTIANNLIARNTAGTGGGGIDTSATSIIIANNTIVENVATNSSGGAGAGGIFFAVSFPPPDSTTNVNNIIAFNSSGIGPANAVAKNRHNCVFGNTNANYDGQTAGPGDVTVNPQFVNPEEFNYRLLGTSPLLNAGDNNYLVGTLDLDGAPRLEGANVDIGAYEYQAPNTAPEAALTSPVNGASYSAPAAFTMNALAADADGAVAKVEFFAGESLLGTMTAPPYSFSLNGLQVGVHALTAVATDNRGARTTSAPVNVTVHPATDPTVSIATPLPDTRIAAPAQVVIQANAADAGGSVTKVEFFVNGSKVGEDITAPYSHTWANVTAGTYTLTAKATDNSGASRTSTPVQITVVNPPQILQEETVYTGGEFRLPMMLETGKSYLIQASTDLVTWTTLQAFTAFGSAIEFVDTEAGNYPGRFYRIVLVE